MAGSYHRTVLVSPLAQPVQPVLQPVRAQVDLSADRPLFWATCLLLVTYFYQIPIIRTPLGLMTWLRMDDLASILLVIAAMSCRRLAPGGFKHPIGRLTLLLFALMPLSIFVARFQLGGTPAFERGLWSLAKYIQFFIVFALVSRLTMTRGRLKVLVAIALVGSAINGLVGVGQYFGYLDPSKLYALYATDARFSETEGVFFRQIVSGEWKRAVGLFTANYVLMGVFMAFGLVLVLAAGVLKLSPGLKLLSMVCSVPIVMGLALSGSRAGMLVAVLSFLIFGIIGRRRWVLLLVIPLVAYVGYQSLLEAEDVTARWTRTSEEWDTGVEALGGGRVGLYVALTSYILVHPTILVLGNGMGGASFWMRDIFGFQIPHSMYLTVLAEHGLPGLILWCILQWMIIRLIWRTAFQTGHDLARGWARVMLSYYLALMAGCFVYEMLLATYSFGAFLGYLQLWVAVTFAFARDAGVLLPVARRRV